MKPLGLVLLFCLAAASLAYAQTDPPAEAPQPQTSEKHHSSFFSFSPPLSLANDTRPLSPGGKFHLFALNTVNPFQFMTTAATAGIEQASDHFPSWGQGAEGYGKRYGAAYADTASNNFFGTFLFPSFFRQDPRYFRKETGSGGARVGYALSRVLVTRTDHGNSAPNISLWMGALASGGISNLYYPAADQGVGLTFRRAGYDLAISAGFNVAREFWPGIARRIFHHKK